jgi:putative salt-induced outer membrane protein
MSRPTNRPAHTLLHALTLATATLLIPAAASILPATAQASWTGQGELGLVMARGNTKSDTGNIKLNLTTRTQRWKHTSSTRMQYGRSNDIESARRWETQWQSELRIDGQPFIFGSVRYEQDRFGGFAYQATASRGLGYNFIDDDDTQLSGSLGAGYRKLRPQRVVRDSAGNIIERIEGEPLEDATGNAGLNYRQQLTDSTALVNNLLVETGASNTMARNDFSLQVSMTARLALGLGYTVRHNADPPQGLKETDQLTTVNLIYKLR